MLRKKMLVLFIAIILSFGGVAYAVGDTLSADGGKVDIETISFFGEAVKTLRDCEQEDTSYISSISLTLDSDVMIVNGEEIPVESPQMLDGYEALPIADIAEALGASVDIDNDSGEITIVDDGEVTVLDTPPDADSIQLYEIQDVADILTLDYIVEGDEILLTRPFQSKMLLVRMRHGKNLPDTHGAADYISDGKGRYVLKYDSVSQAKEAYDAVKAMPDCQYIAPNRIYFAFGAPSSVGIMPLAMPVSSWGTARINAQLMTQHLINNGKTSTPITVAIIDSGVYPAHPHLAGRVVPGYNFSSSNPGNPFDTNDEYYHGTHVAGTVVDCTPENVKIMPLKVLDKNGSGDEAAAVNAIIWAIDNGAKVLNISIGTVNTVDDPDSDWDELVRNACEYVVSKGGVIVSAAGGAVGIPPINTKFVTPSRLSSVITVVATDEADKIAAFSNFGDAVNVSAPGVKIMSSLPYNLYAAMDGTSFAAPHVSAAAAMLILDNPFLDFSGVMEAIHSICDDLSGQDWDSTYGWGIIDFANYVPCSHEWDDGIVTAPTCTEGGYTTYTCESCGETEDRDFTPINPNAHSFTVPDGTVAPTCTEQGHSTYKCERCNETNTIEGEPALGHSLIVPAVTVAPTCKSQGYTTYECERCDETEDRDFTPINPNAHSFTVPDGTVAPTCTEQGYSTYKCERCNETNTVEGEPALGHSLIVPAVTVAPTCTTQGYTTYKCERCDETEDRDFTPVNPDAHSFTVPTETVAPTCTTQGYTTYKCERCNETNTVEGEPALGHSLIVPSVTVAPTCTSQGYTTYKCERCDETEDRDFTPVNPNAHSFTVSVGTVTPTCTSQGHSTYKCERCDETENRDFTPVNPDAHSFTVPAETVAPTCTAQGYTTYKCERCNETEDRDLKPVNPNAHSFTQTVETIAPTCSDGGYTTYKCERCNETEKRDFTPVDPNAHSFTVHTGTIAPTCLNSGCITYRCEYCNETNTIDGEPALGHSFTIPNVTVAPTCKSQGYTTYKCERCDETEDRDFTPINPNAHSFTVPDGTVAPTCTAQGHLTYKCERCDETNTVVGEPALGHSLNVPAGTVKPTCTSQGYTTFKCERCDETEDRDFKPIDPNAHSFIVPAGTVAPTCTAQEHSTYKCEYCDETNTVDGEPALGHSLIVPVRIVKPTCTAQGYTTYKCERCDETEDRDFTPVDPDAHKWSSGVVTIAATEKATGVKTYTCELCNVTKTEVIPMLKSTTETPLGGSFAGPPITDTEQQEEIETEEIPLTEAKIIPAFINGYPDKTIRCSSTMSKEEFVTILFKLKNPDDLPEADTANPTFNDVASDRWSYDAIEWAVQAGIIEADSEGNFQPARPLTRAEIAVMLLKAEGWTEMAENIFSDISEHPHRDDILMAVEAGIFVGYPDETFKPDGTATRAEVITSLVRYMLGGEPADEMWVNKSVIFTDISREHWAYKYVVLATTGFEVLP